MWQNNTDGSLKGRLIIVTGASSGVGYATVRRLVQVENAMVVAIARRRVFRIEALAKHARGGQLLALTGDMSVAAQAESLIGEIHKRFGPIDAYVHGVHRSLRLPSHIVTDSDFDLTMRINVKSAMHGVQVTTPIFEKQQRGTFVIYNPEFPASEEFGAGEALHAASSQALKAMTNGWQSRMSRNNISIREITANGLNEPAIPGSPTVDQIIVDALRHMINRKVKDAVLPTESAVPDVPEPLSVVKSERGGLQLTWFGP